MVNFLSAKVIAAEGEMKSARALKEASDVMCESPAALQVNIGREQLRIGNVSKKIFFLFSSASLPSNLEQYCIRKEFHYHLPVTNRLVERIYAKIITQSFLLKLFFC